jgi:hypothetical protein
MHHCKLGANNLTIPTRTHCLSNPSIIPNLIARIAASKVMSVLVGLIRMFLFGERGSMKTVTSVSNRCGILGNRVLNTSSSSFNSTSHVSHSLFSFLYI